MTYTAYAHAGGGIGLPAPDVPKPRTRQPPHSKADVQRVLQRAARRQVHAEARAAGVVRILGRRAIEQHAGRARAGKHHELARAARAHLRRAGRPSALPSLARSCQGVSLGRACVSALLDKALGSPYDGQRCSGCHGAPALCP